MTRWHRVANGCVRGRHFDIEIASVEGGYVARALMEGQPPLAEWRVCGSEQAAVGQAMGLAYGAAICRRRGTGWRRRNPLQA